MRRSEKRKSEKKEDAGARKGRKVAIHCVFPMICGSGGSKSRLAKAAGAEPPGQMRDEKLHAAKHISKSKRAKHLSFRPLLKVELSKISKSKCTKHTNVGPLLEVEMSKKCTPLWREVHFQVKMVKKLTGSDRFLTFRCRKSARHCGAKHISKSQVSKTAGFESFLTFRYRKSAHWLT